MAICWGLGLPFCTIAVAIVVYLFLQGIKYLKPSMLITSASGGFTQSRVELEPNGDGLFDVTELGVI